MANSVDLQLIKQKASEFVQIWSKKLAVLNEHFARSGIDGVKLWFLSQHQIFELELALKDLVSASEDPEFTLLQVHTTLSSFILHQEDLAQAEWYKTAHVLLEEFEQLLHDANRFDLKKLQTAQNELKFISQADEFHQRYHLKPIQSKVSKMYQTLFQAISEFKSTEKQKIELSKSEQETKQLLAREKLAKMEEKKAMIANMKIKEKRLAISEEKKRQIAEKERLQTLKQQQQEHAELEQKKLELERESKLQDSYIDLQLDMKLAGLAADELIQLLTKKVGSGEMTDEQKNTLTALLEKS